MAEIFVAKASEIKEGERRFVDNAGDSIGVLRAQGALHAYRNVCPHQGGPVCEGLLIHKVEEIIAPDKTYQGMTFDQNTLHVVCPWHGWEFDVATGRCAGDGRERLRKYQVVERGGDVYVVV